MPELRIRFFFFEAKFELPSDFPLSRTESEKGCKMYEPFFGMERRPFSATPDPGCFFSGSSELQAVLDELTICVERGQGIGIVTAPAGVGKTLLCQRLATDLRQRDDSVSQFECVYLSNSNFPTRRSLLQAILFEMGDEYSRRDEPELRLDLRSRLLSLRPEREALVLIVDEAHLFAEELIEELRTMADIADNGSPLVRIILSGQHELEERLTDRAFDALNQRVSSHVFLESLTISESTEYLRHRLAWAGCDIESVFSEEAVSVITRASGGVPRCLNQLSDHSLLLAFASDEKPVSEGTVREALEDLKQLPLHWNDVSDGSAIVGYVEDVDDDLTLDSEASADESSQESDESQESDDTFNLAEDSAETFASSFEAATSSDGFSSTETAADGSSGIVESVTAATHVSSEATPEPSSSPLDGGIEFDFSRDSTPESEPENGIADTAESETPETAVFEFSSDSSDEDVSGETDGCDESELAGDDTHIQVINSVSQETILESASGPGSVADDDLQNVERSEVCDVDSGICFQITSSGFEVDGFESPEKPSVESSGNDDDSLIERAVDHDAVNDCTNSAAEITNTLPSQDSIPIRSEQDHGVPESEIVMGFIESANSERASSGTGIEEPVAEESEPAADELNPVQELEPASESDDSTRQSTGIVIGPAKHEESIVTDESPIGDSRYEEELVFDPYAALQESESAGIVWDVSSFSDQGHVENPIEKTAEQADDGEFVEESGHVEEGSSVAIPANGEASIECESPDENEEPIAESSETANEYSDSGSDFDGSDGNTQSTEFSPAISVAGEDHATEEPADQTQTSFELDATEASTAEALESVGSVSDDAFEDIGEEEVVEATEGLSDLFAKNTLIFSEEASTEIRDVESTVESESGSLESIDPETVEPEPVEQGALAERADIESEGLDIVQPADVETARPDRLVDSVLPLLNELDADLDYVGTPELASRSVLDIEAELIQAIEHDSSDLEDEIGATMLDICLDTQSALQDSAAALRNAEEAAESTAETGPEELNDIIEELPAEPFDIVQPEAQRREEGPSYQLDPHFLESTAETSQPDASSSPQPLPVTKPFGRLFSDLRRRTH